MLVEDAGPGTEVSRQNAKWQEVRVAVWCAYEAGFFRSIRLGLGIHGHMQECTVN